MIDTAPIDTPPEREIYTQLTTNGQTGEGRGGRRRGKRSAARADTRAPCDGRNTITVNKNDNIIREGRGGCEMSLFGLRKRRWNLIQTQGVAIVLQSVEIPQQAQATVEVNNKSYEGFSMCDTQVHSTWPQARVLFSFTKMGHT